MCSVDQICVDTKNIDAHSAAQHLHYVEIRVLHGSIVLKCLDTFDNYHVRR